MRLLRCTRAVCECCALRERRTKRVMKKGNRAREREKEKKQTEWKWERKKEREREEDISLNSMVWRRVNDAYHCGQPTLTTIGVDRAPKRGKGLLVFFPFPPLQHPPPPLPPVFVVPFRVPVEAIEIARSSTATLIPRRLSGAFCFSPRGLRLRGNHVPISRPPCRLTNVAWLVCSSAVELTIPSSLRQGIHTVVHVRARVHCRFTLQIRFTLSV